jgi:hypothetical protein
MDREHRHQLEIDLTGVPVGLDEDLLGELAESQAVAEALADRIRDEPRNRNTLIHRPPVRHEGGPASPPRP